MEEVSNASTYQLLLWWCLCGLDPEDDMIVEVMIEKRLTECNPRHLEAISAGTGLEFCRG
jgi:hypothetical protein